MRHRRGKLAYQLSCVPYKSIRCPHGILLSPSSRSSIRLAARLARAPDDPGPTSSTRTEKPAGMSNIKTYGGCKENGGAISTSLWISLVGYEVRTFPILAVSSSCQSFLGHAPPYNSLSNSLSSVSLLDCSLVLPRWFVLFCQYLRLQANVYLPLINHFQVTPPVCMSLNHHDETLHCLGWSFCGDCPGGSSPYSDKGK